jgi:hypothetical protein
VSSWDVNVYRVSHERLKINTRTQGFDFPFTPKQTCHKPINEVKGFINGLIRDT